MDDDQNKSPHILNASSNLLGLCFVVLTSLKLLNISHKTILDELTFIATMLFMASCMLSFLAIRNSKRGTYYESIADYLFITGLLFLFLTTIAFSLDLIH